MAVDSVFFCSSVQAFLKQSQGANPCRAGRGRSAAYIPGAVPDLGCLPWLERQPSASIILSEAASQLPLAILSRAQLRISTGPAADSSPRILQRAQGLRADVPVDLGSCRRRSASRSSACSEGHTFSLFCQQRCGFRKIARRPDAAAASPLLPLHADSVPGRQQHIAVSHPAITTAAVHNNGAFDPVCTRRL
jgi:hypothetical protein